ncbi:MAG: sulfoacetaldehyde acetyltransferase [Paracoccaceae bacterium]
MTRMTASEAIVETFVAQGVEKVFGIVGSAFMDALDIFPAAGIEFVPVVHEQGAAHMADGYARSSGKVGVCIAQNGPGITNFVTGVAAAFWAHTPVVVFTPETGSNTQGLGGFQEAEQLPFFETITKYQAHVENQKRIPELLSRCFDYARLDRGPTQFNIPRDLFYGEQDFVIPRPVDVERGPGGPKSLSEAADLIAGAKFPVILSGGGIVMGGGVPQVIELAERMQAPVVNTYLHNDSFPCDHPLWVGPIGYQGSKAAMKLLAQADLVLALGTRLGPFGTLPQHGLDYWPKDAKVVQVDVDARKIGLVKEVGVGIAGDAAAAATDLLDRLANRALAADGNREARLAEIKAQKDAWEAELDIWGQDANEPGHVAPRRALRELERAMPENAMVTTDIGNICSVSNSYLRFRAPNSFFAAMSFGNCGYAYPTAIGAKIGRPDRPAVAYVGDGAWGMSMAETLTAVRENVPVTAVVFNNEQWGAEKKNQVDFYGDRYVGSNLKNPRWSDVATSMGARGVFVDHPDQVGDALRDCVASGVPSVLEIMMTKELGDPFRRDALKKPHRLLEKYAHTNMA